MSAPFTILETPLDPTAVVCRGCLAESGEMKNIYEWGLAEDYFLITAIAETLRKPGLSELLCSKCEETLNSFKQFRKRCQASDHHLKSNLKADEDTPVVLAGKSPAHTLVNPLRSALLRRLMSESMRIFTGIHGCNDL
ncbi:unnamed protein product [Chrysodeixis includens]|uniref:ZAD domain-containing protein n=1 Tax=Chrysodeixis includens TaxID=689277 RepID=A0A9N8KZB8_CHRIL|nr:unnamed protein product [Chrysodeixis includens]